MLGSSHQYGPFEITTKPAFATLLLISESIAEQSVLQRLWTGVLSLWWWVKGQEAEGQDGIWSVTQVLPGHRGGTFSEKREALPWGKWAALPPYPVDPNFPLSVTSLMKICMQTSPNCFPLHSSRRASSWQPEFLAKIGLPLPLRLCYCSGNKGRITPNIMVWLEISCGNLQQGENKVFDETRRVTKYKLSWLLETKDSHNGKNPTRVRIVWAWSFFFFLLHSQHFL